MVNFDCIIDLLLRVWFSTHYSLKNKGLKCTYLLKPMHGNQVLVKGFLMQGIVPWYLMRISSQELDKVDLKPKKNWQMLIPCDKTLKPAFGN